MRSRLLYGSWFRHLWSITTNRGLRGAFTMSRHSSLHSIQPVVYCDRHIHCNRNLRILLHHDLQSVTWKHERTHLSLIGRAQLLVQRQETKSLISQFRTYYEFTKPKIWYLLVFTSLSATFVATRVLSIAFSPLGWIVAASAIAAGCAGCNALTNYHDRDVDAVMLRTRHRPLPSGRLAPRAASTFALGLFSRRYPDAPRCRGFSNRSPADHSLLSHHGTLLTCAVSSRLSWSHLRSRGLGRRTRQPGRESLGPLQADREECVENVQGLESLPVPTLHCDNC